MAVNPDARVLVQFVTPEGEETGPSTSVLQDTSPPQLSLLVNNLLKNDEPLPYAFYAENVEVTDSLRETIVSMGTSVERVLKLVYQPEAVFRVRPVTRCTASMTGHTEAVLFVSFSPDSRRLATGSGDTTVRLWNLSTQLPETVLEGHRNWVLALSWSPGGEYLASGGMDSDVRVWNPDTGASMTILKGHRNWITSMAWEPLHICPASEKLASASKDGTIRLWNVRTGHCQFTLSGHSASVTCVRWSGEGLILSGSQDRTIKVWNGENGKLVRTLEGHAHWVNSIALSTDHVLRTGAFDVKGTNKDDHSLRAGASGVENRKAKALERYVEAKGGSQKNERLASASDDCTVFLWDFLNAKKPLCRLTGHMKPVNFVSFSPDGRLLASGSFDTNVKVWDGVSGKFLGNLRGHVGPVYMVGWSFDSRMVISSSKDTTLKVWDSRTRKLKIELPGHADEVFAVDWSPNGEWVASGGKDREVKLWHH